MPSVGFTLSKLKDGLDPESPELLRKWQLNKQLFDSFFGFDYPLGVYKGLEEPNMIFTVGPFAEQDEHLQDFARSDEMDDYMNEFGETLDLRGAFHLEKDWQEMPSSAPFVSVGRFFVETDRMVEFEKSFNGMMDSMPAGAGGTGSLSGWTTTGGWRDRVEGDDAQRLANLSRKGTLANWQAGIDGPDDGSDDETREWVTFFGWESQEAMIKSLSEMDKDMGDRDASWQPMKDLVAWSRQVTIRNYAKISYL